MKRSFVRFTLATLLLFSTLTGTANAASARSGALLNEPGLSAESEAGMREATAQKEAAYGIGGGGGFRALSLNKYGLQTRPVTNYKQERTYWCGPASVRQSLSFHRKDSGSGTSLPSQTTLASEDRHDQ